MRFIRAFWGDLDNFNGRHKNEIIFESKRNRLNVLVYVWGIENFNFIKSLGFECILVSEKSTEYGNDFLYDSSTYMIHKLIAVKLGIQNFSEVVFLDWDCIQQKPIDNKFYHLLRQQNDKIQMPLYSYPKNYYELVLNAWKDISEKEKLYIDKQTEFLKKYNYDWGDDYITPNAGFIYCTDIEIINKLIKINTDLKIGVASEEMSFMVFLIQKNITIIDYIKNYEPLICNAKHDSHFNQKKLNNYITTLINKNLYFIHE